jgi:hypothetical protein
MNWWVSFVVVSQKKSGFLLGETNIASTPATRTEEELGCPIRALDINYNLSRPVAEHSTFKESEVGCGADRTFEEFNVTQVNLSLCN